MNKSEFIRAYADKLGVTIREAEGNFEALVETLTQTLKKVLFISVLFLCRVTILPCGIITPKEKVSRDITFAFPLTNLLPH